MCKEHVELTLGRFFLIWFMIVFVFVGAGGDGGSRARASASSFALSSVWSVVVQMSPVSFSRCAGGVSGGADEAGGTGVSGASVSSGFL